MKHWKPIAAAIAALFLAACGGGAPGAPGVPALAPNAAPVTRMAGAMKPAVGGTITFTLRILTTALNPLGYRGVAYTSWAPGAPATATVVANVGPTSSLCKTSGTTRTCTIRLTLNAGGPYKVVSALFNKPPSGNAFPGATQIGGGVVGLTVTPHVTNFNFTTAPNVAATALVIQPFSIHSLVSSTAYAALTGFSSKNEAIVSNKFVGSSGPVAIDVATDATTKSVLALSTATISGPTLGAFSISYSSPKASATQVTQGFTAKLTYVANGPGVTPGSRPFQAAKPAFTELTLPAPTSDPQRIIKAPDGTMFFGEFNAGKMGRIDTSLHLIKEYTGFYHPQTFAVSNGSVWVANNDGHSSITRITMAGVVTPFALPDNTYPAGISAAPGCLWFGSVFNNYLSYISITTGAYGQQYPLPAGSSYPEFSALGSDGNTYFVLNGVGKILQVSQYGNFSHTYAIPGSNTSPQDIMLGPDGNLWFADVGNALVYRMTNAGVFTKYTFPSGTCPAGPMTVGPDGKFWLPLCNELLGRLDPVTKNVTLIFLPHLNNGTGIVTGPDNALYITEDAPAKIARFQ